MPLNRSTPATIHPLPESAIQYTRARARRKRALDRERNQRRTNARNAAKRANAKHQRKMYERATRDQIKRVRKRAARTRTRARTRALHGHHEFISAQRPIDAYRNKARRPKIEIVSRNLTRPHKPTRGYFIVKDLGYCSCGWRKSKPVSRSKWRVHRRRDNELNELKK